ncbi:MAG: YihY/virulence factor BrkB family protein [Pseudomonadota bacterium]|nr:YihY/virulence factor BrkB family protein [Pseudomonadota bacterium]
MKRKKREEPSLGRTGMTERTLSALGFLIVAAGVLAFGRSKTPSSPADAPHRIPARGWRRIAVNTWNEANADQIPQAAGGVTFFALLSIFPAMAAFVSLYGLFADAGQVPHHLAILAGILPRSALSFVSDEMTRLAGGKHPALGVAFALGLIISLLSANGAVKALFNGLNTAYEVREQRGLIQLNLISLTFTLGGLFFVLVTFGLMVAGPAVLRMFGWQGGLDPLLIGVARWPAMFLASMISLSLLYRFGPSRSRARWRWVTPGSLFATFGWLAVSMGFSWYVGNFGHYERTYGSLGAVIGFMTWLWLSMIVVLAGAELNSEIEAEAGAEPAPSAA